MFGFFSWLLKLFASLGLRNKQARILFLGLDNAGKTTLLHKLRYGNVRSFIPTVRARTETFTLANTEFTAWDLGGHEAVRELWTQYYTEVDAIVFVVDTADIPRLPEAQKELANILKGSEMDRTPICVLGNKSDLPKSVSAEELIAYLQLTPNDMTPEGKTQETLEEGKRPLRVIKCSLIDGFGYQEALEWVVEAIGAV